MKKNVGNLHFTQESRVNRKSYGDNVSVFEKIKLNFTYNYLEK